MFMLALLYLVRELSALLGHEQAEIVAHAKLVARDHQLALRADKRLRGKHHRLEPLVLPAASPIEAPWSRQLPIISGGTGSISIETLPPVSDATKVVNPTYGR